MAKLKVSFKKTNYRYCAKDGRSKFQYQITGSEFSASNCSILNPVSNPGTMLSVKKYIVTFAHALLAAESVNFDHANGRIQNFAGKSTQ